MFGVKIENGSERLPTTLLELLCKSLMWRIGTPRKTEEFVIVRRKANVLYKC